MKISQLKQAFPIIVLILILTAVYWKNFQSTHTVNGPSCNLMDGICTTVSEQLSVTLEIHDGLQIEEELNTTISFPATHKVNNSWVEGVNMFMGRFLVELGKVKSNRESVDQSGVLFLGSCSEPKMHWKLVVELEEKGTNKKVFREFHFSTTQF